MVVPEGAWEKVVVEGVHRDLITHQWSTAQYLEATLTLTGGSYALRITFTQSKKANVRVLLRQVRHGGKTIIADFEQMQKPASRGST